jgi:hypothetical protein
MVNLSTVLRLDQVEQKEEICPSREFTSDALLLRVTFHMHVVELRW